MAAELVTPLDDISGMPLPLLPTEMLDRENERTNWHHAWHANSAPQLQGIGGRALRHSRVQLVRDIDHNHGDRSQGKLTYHDHYIGPPLPTTDQERLKLCVIAAAGYVPDTAIDLWAKQGPRVVRMTTDQKSLLKLPEQPRPMNQQDHSWVLRKARDDYATVNGTAVNFEDFVSGRITDFNARRRKQAAFGLRHLVYQYDPLRAFLRQTVLEQDLSHVREARVDEFLHTTDDDRKLRLGRWLIGEAVKKSTDHIQAPYRELYAAGNLHPSMPRDVNGLVVWKLGMRRKRDELVSNYENRIKQSLGVVA